MVWGRCCCIHRGHGCVVRVPVEAVQGGCCALSVAPKSVQICGCLGGGDGVGVSSVWLGVGGDLGFVEVGSSWWPGDEHVNPQGLVAFGDVSPDPSKSPTPGTWHHPGACVVVVWEPAPCGNLGFDVLRSPPSYKMKPGGFLPLGAKGTRGLPKSPGSPQTAGLSPACRLLRFPSCRGHPRASTLGCPEPPTHQAAAGWVALGGFPAGGCPAAIECHRPLPWGSSAKEADAAVWEVAAGRWQQGGDIPWGCPVAGG